MVTSNGPPADTPSSIAPSSAPPAIGTWRGSGRCSTPSWVPTSPLPGLRRSCNGRARGTAWPSKPSRTMILSKRAPLPDPKSLPSRHEVLLMEHGARGTGRPESLAAPSRERTRVSEVTVGCAYFAKPGEHNTARVLEVARQRAEDLHIRSVLVASTRGDTGARAAESFKGFNLVVVSHSAGFREPNHQELTEANRRLIEAAGARILTCQHAFGGVGRAGRKKLKTYEREEVIA